MTTQQEKEELLQASKHIHDLRDVNPELPMVNTLMHLYLAPFLIEIDSSLETKNHLNKEINNEKLFI